MMTTDGSVALGQEYWSEACQAIPADATMILIEMGEVVDYYRPNPGVTFCEMLTTGAVNHEWSRDGSTWHVPSDYPYHYGGSSSGNIPDGQDSRNYISFWGDDSTPGGCCHASYTDTAAWGQAFNMYYITGQGLCVCVRAVDWCAGVCAVSAHICVYTRAFVHTHM